MGGEPEVQRLGAGYLIASSIVCPPPSGCKAWPFGPPPLAACGLDRPRAASSTLRPCDQCRNVDDSTDDQAVIARSAVAPESRSRGIFQVGLATHFAAAETRSGYGAGP